MPDASPRPEAGEPLPRRRRVARDYLLSVLCVVASTAVAFLLFRRTELADIVMIYILGIIVVATRLGRGPSLLTSLLSVAAFDFIFVSPYFTFAVSELRHVGTFAVMLLVGVVVGNLTERIRAAARLASAREARTQALYSLGQELSQCADPAALVATAAANVTRHFQGRATLLLRADAGGLGAPDDGFPLDAQERQAALRVLDQAEPRWPATPSGGGHRVALLPLQGSQGTLGVICVVAEGPARWEDPDQRQLLEAFARPIAVALERALLAEQSGRDRRRAEEERLRNALLSSVSHDLRTPLGIITGAVSTALENPGLPEALRRELLSSAQDEAQRLHRLVSNLLDLTRLQAGSLELHTEWIPLEEVVGAVLNRPEFRADIARIQVHLPDNLPPVAMDPVLMEQVLSNLLDNALKYAPPGSPVEIEAWVADGSFTLAVADRGPGLAPGEEDRIFDKLARGSAGSRRPGAGLGLAICKGIVTAHGGRIEAVNRGQGGARFRVALPQGTPPELPAESP